MWNSVLISKETKLLLEFCFKVIVFICFMHYAVLIYLWAFIRWDSSNHYVTSSEPQYTQWWLKIYLFKLTSDILVLSCVVCCCLVAKSCQTLLRPQGLYSTRVLCPQYSPGKNTGMGSRFLFQGTSPTQESNPHYLRWQADSLPLSHQGSPLRCIVYDKFV